MLGTRNHNPGLTLSIAIVVSCSLGLLSAAPASGAMKVTLSGNQETPQVAFACAEIRKAAESVKDVPGPLAVEFTIDSTSLKAQCYRIDREGGKIRVIGGDAAGAMYGGLDLAEAIRLGTLAELEGRATTRPTSRGAASSSTSRSTCARPATPTPATPPSRTSPRCGAWTSGASSSTRWRGTASTCSRSGTCIPFPSLVKVPEYPDVALDDVMRTTVKFDTHLSASAARTWSARAMLANLEIVKKMTIDEKIRVLARGHAARPRPRHRGLPVHLEHLRLGRRGQVRHHRRTRTTRRRSTTSARACARRC